MQDMKTRVKLFLLWSCWKGAEFLVAANRDGYSSALPDMCWDKTIWDVLL